MIPEPHEDEVSRQSFQDSLSVIKEVDLKVLVALRHADRTISSLIKSLPSEKKGASIRRAQYESHRQAIQEEINNLWEKIGDGTDKGLVKVTKVSADGFTKLIETISEHSKDKDGTSLVGSYAPSFVSAGEVAGDALRHRLINEARIRLSHRVYKNGTLSSGKIDDIVNDGIATGQSSKEIARRVQKHIRPNTPGGTSYAAMRLARTEINNSYHDMNRQLAKDSPFVLTVKWTLSHSHPERDICDEYANHKAGFGKGVYPADSIPFKPHPHCLCFTIPMVDKDFDTKLLNGEYNDWLKANGQQPILRDAIIAPPIPDKGINEKTGVKLLDEVPGAKPHFFAFITPQAAKDRFNLDRDYFLDKVIDKNEFKRRMSQLQSRLLASGSDANVKGKPTDGYYKVIGDIQKYMKSKGLGDYFDGADQNPELIQEEKKKLDLKKEYDNIVFAFLPTEEVASKLVILRDIAKAEQWDHKDDPSAFADTQMWIDKINDWFNLHKDDLKPSRKEYDKGKEEDGYERIDGYSAAKSFFEKYKDWFPSLSRGGRGAVADYQGSWYRPINKSLRLGKKEGDESYQRKIDNAIRNLDASGTDLRENLVVYRGTSTSIWENLGVGSVFRDKGFVSTSVVRDVADSFGGMQVMEIRLNKGMKILPIASAGLRHETEWEVLLPRGTYFHILEIRPNRIIVDAYESEMEVPA